MAGLAHTGVGLAAKHFAPKVPLWILLVGAYTIDIIWGIFFFAGIEAYPTTGVVATCPWSHGLFMSVIWTAAAVLITVLISGSLRTGLFMGALVFSHWVVDFISKPMLAAFPTDSGLPLLFDGSPVVGLGMYSTQIGVNIGEYGSLLLGLVIYIFTVRKLRKEKRVTAEGKGIASE